MVRSRANPHEQTKRRLPHRAILRRSDSFLPADTDELEAAIREIAGCTETYRYRGSRGEENDHVVIRFYTAELAQKMQEWIVTSGIEHRPFPKRRTAGEWKQIEQIAMEWGHRTGAIEKAIEVYERHRAEDTSETGALFYAAMMIRELGPPSDEWHRYAKWFVNSREQLGQPPCGRGSGLPV